MSDPTEPESFAGTLTAELLRAVLHPDSGWEERPTGIVCEPIVENPGFAGSTYRCRLDQKPPADAEGPTTLIAKLPSQEPELRRLFERFGLYRREAGFYRDLREQTPVPTPYCYYSAHEPADGYFLLLLEDLQPARPVDRAEGLSRELAERALRELARMHARWWDDPGLEQLEWLVTPNDDQVLRPLLEAYPRVWGTFETSHGSRLPTYVRTLGQELLWALAEVQERLSIPPLTLVHGDYQAGNIFFTDDGAVRGIIDWQVCSRSRAACDVVHLIVRSMPPEERSRCEPALLDGYRRALLEEGVDYPARDLLTDYRLALIAEFASSLVLSHELAAAGEGGGPEEDTERAALSRIGEIRFFAALADLDFKPLLRSLARTRRQSPRRLRR